ncbi:MAG: hypothetical protein HYV59_00315 [Planctomycetes bacterium]|nr:hypothetical protein [Planctomycetota bacterium]
MTELKQGQTLGCFPCSRMASACMGIIEETGLVRPQAEACGYQICWKPV